jgi:hypothetical protein
MARMKKIVNNYHLRIWVYPHPIGWAICKKIFRRLGFIFYLGRIRISITLIGPRYILFNPFTLEKITQ